MNTYMPAYPTDNNEHPGLTKKEFFCVQLRVPQTGDVDLDALIRSSNQSRIEEQIFLSLLSNNAAKQSEALITEALALSELFCEVVEESPKEHIQHLLESMADEVEMFIRRADDWVSRTLIVNSLGLRREVDPLGQKNHGQKGFLCQVIMRLLEDQGRVEYKKEGDRTYYRAINAGL